MFWSSRSAPRAQATCALRSCYGTRFALVVTIPSRRYVSVKALDIWQACSRFPATVQKKVAFCTTELRTASNASTSLFDSADTTILTEPNEADVLCALTWMIADRPQAVSLSNSSAVIRRIASDRWAFARATSSITWSRTRMYCDGRARLPVSPRR